ncbi:RAxF-45 family protein [Oceanobacillus kapialis]|uniref:RAxF-45 family protein n=1 Tax=Oceanobacillus kapialis TaxID=481353 RepID=A0ABW5PVA6_9BACI
MNRTGSMAKFREYLWICYALFSINFTQGTRMSILGVK